MTATVTSDDHGRAVDVAQIVPHGRARTTREIHGLLERARIPMDVATLEAVLITCEAVRQVASGVWTRR